MHGGAGCPSVSHFSEYNLVMDQNSLITSLSNPLVKKTRSLKGRKTRDNFNLFLVEGLHPVGSVLEAGWEVDALLYAPELLSGDYAQKLVQDACQIGLKPQPVSAKVIGVLASLFR